MDRAAFICNAVRYAHHLWSQWVRVGDHVIDATCGNGYDTLYLAQLALDANQGVVVACDIQEAAIKQAKGLLQERLDSGRLARVQWILGSHATWPESLPAQSFRLIVYNLGYLPGGNKSLTTQWETTLQSLLNAMPLVVAGGAISVTCYPGHTEGDREERLLLDFMSKLDPREWCCVHHRWFNRHKAPSLVLLIRV